MLINEPLFRSAFDQLKSQLILCVWPLLLPLLSIIYLELNRFEKKQQNKLAYRQLH